MKIVCLVCVAALLMVAQVSGYILLAKSSGGKIVILYGKSSTTVTDGCWVTVAQLTDIKGWDSNDVIGFKGADGSTDTFSCPVATAVQTSATHSVLVEKVASDADDACTITKTSSPTKNVNLTDPKKQTRVRAIRQRLVL